MELLRKSPMLGVLTALAAGMALYDKLGAYALILGVPAVITAVIFFSYKHDLPGQWQFFAAVIIIALLCALRIYYVISRPDPEILYINDEIAAVSYVREWGRNYAALIDTKNNGRFAARFQFDELMEGTRIRFSGETKNFRHALRPGDFDESRYWKARGAASWILMRNIEILPERFSLPLIRHKISRALKIYMPELTGEYLRAAWLGQHTKDLDEKHRRWGTSHLLAVSGFHVGIVILCAGFLFGKNFYALSIILWVYILLTGAAPSAMRAGLMIQTGLIARVLGRRLNGVNSVSLAAVILLLYRPFLFWDIGWRLSVSAALAITAMPLIRFVWVLVSPALLLVTFPQAVSSLKSVPAVGIFLNLIAPFYFSFTFMIASVIAIFRLINFPFSQILIMAVDGMFILWEKFAAVSESVIYYAVPPEVFNIIPVSWLGVGVLILLMCRHLNFSACRTLTAMTCISFTAFMIFM